METNDKVKKCARLLSIPLIIILMAGCAATNNNEKNFAQLLQPDSPLYVQAHSLNFRSCPSVECKITKVLHRGNQVHRFSLQNNWSQITDSEGNQGWVSSKFIAKNQPSPLPERAQKHIPKEIAAKSAQAVAINEKILPKPEKIIIDLDNDIIPIHQEKKSALGDSDNRTVQTSTVVNLDSLYE